jgi:hypothetical protein
MFAVLYTTQVGNVKKWQGPAFDYHTATNSPPVFMEELISRMHSIFAAISI